MYLIPTDYYDRLFFFFFYHFLPNYWWLRSPYTGGDVYAYLVGPSGDVYNYGNYFESFVTHSYGRKIAGHECYQQCVFYRPGW